MNTYKQRWEAVVRHIMTEPKKKKEKELNECWVKLADIHTWTDSTKDREKLLQYVNNEEKKEQMGH